MRETRHFGRSTVPDWRRIAARDRHHPGRLAFFTQRPT